MSESENEIQLVTTSITKANLQTLAERRFGDMIKAVVDIDKKIMAVGGELHADEEGFLLEQGSEQQNLWGINIYIDKAFPDSVEFDSMINIRPSQNNRSRSVEDVEIRKVILGIVGGLIQQ